MDAINYHGTVTIKSKKHEGFVHIDVQDLGPGVPLI